MKPLSMSLFILLLLLTLATNLFAQAKPSAASDRKAFCRNDPRPEVRAYCKNLAAFLAAVIKEKSLRSPNLTTDNPNFADPLNKLDLTKPKAVDDFITATATTLVTKGAIAEALRAADQARPDQQFGTSSKASGTTSLISKAGSAELLALALDTGALSRSVNGTTATLNTNADQMFRLITGSNPDCVISCNSLGWFEDKVLNSTNLSASFGLAQQSSKTTPTSGQASGTTSMPVSNVAIPTGAGRLSSFTVRYELLNKFDPRSEKFKAAWKKQVTSLKANIIAIGDDTDAVLDVLRTHKPFSDPNKAALVQSAEKKMGQSAAQDPSGKKLIESFEEFWSEVTSEALQDPKLASAVSKAVQDRAVYRTAWFKALAEAVGNLFTVEYSYNRPLSQPQTHEFKLVYGYDFKTMGMLTFNGGVSIYGGAIPTGAKYGRLHDGQISSEYDRTLSGTDKALQTQLSLAGYWQYQPNPSVLNIAAGTVVPGTTIPLPNGTQEFVGTAGSSWITQAKITIKSSGGIEIPIAVSWSNKTDLLRGSKVGGQFGISYNFSSLIGLFGGSGGNH